MNDLIKNNKAAIILLVLIIAGGFVYYTSDKRPQEETNQLIPIDSITHGHGLAVDIRDESQLYIATHHGLLVLKNDKDLYRVGSNKDDYMGFSPHPTESKVFLASGHPMSGGNIGFQKSEDGGFTWQKISNGVHGPVDFHAMAISPANPNIIYGWYRGAIQRSDDGGATWKIVNGNILTVQLAAHPSDENIVYAATPDGRGVFISKDKGATWEGLSRELENGQVAVVAINSAESNTMLVYSERHEGLAKSKDAGKTWSKISERFGGETILYIAYSPHGHNTVYALTHKNSIYKSTDGGDTWSKIL